jgi:hypothetical protein
VDNEETGEQTIKIKFLVDLRNKEGIEARNTLETMGEMG